MGEKKKLSAILEQTQKARQAQQDTVAPKSTQVYGPYPDGDKWRVVLRSEGGQRVSKSLDSREEAEAFMRDVTHQVESLAVPRTIGEAVSEYMDDKEAAGLKPLSIRTVRDKLTAFLPLAERLTISSERASEIYREATTRPCRYKRPVSVCTHRAQLRCARAFFAWCVERRYLDRNPFERVKGTGRIQSGKPQLRLDEVRQLVEVLHREANAGDEGASALLLQLVFGARSSEILGRQVRDIDDGGRVLWIPDGKTKNARRRLSVPEEVQPLLKALTGQRGPEDFLIGAGRSKPYTSPVLWKRLRRFCRMAGIRQVCPHSLRGLHSTLAIEAGATSGAVIAQLGHSSFQITERHYLDKDRQHDASMRRVAGTLFSPQEDLQSELADLSADEVRALLAAIRSRRSPA